MLGLGGMAQGSAVAQRAVLADTLSAQQAAGEGQRAKPGRTALFALGAVLLALFVTGAVVGQTTGSETKKTGAGGESQTTTTSTTSGAKEEAKTTTTGSKEEPRTTISRTVTVTPKSESTEVDKTAPSEGLLLALLGTGVVLILAGGFYSRITAIKLPGGVDLTLSPEESTKVQEAVNAKAPAEANSSQVVKAAVVAHEVARTQKQATGEELSDEIVELAAQTGLRAAHLV